MDADRFATLSRALSDTRSRRGALGLLAGSAVSGLITRGAGDAAAHNARKACQKKSGKQKKECVKKAKRHNATHTAGPGRTTVTRTFTNSKAINIPANGPGATTGSPAKPYPSEIKVAGFTKGRILDVNLTLHGFSHTFPEDVDILLSARHLGKNAIVLSDVGPFDGDDAVNLILKLDDQAATPLTGSTSSAESHELLVSGTFQPANYKLNPGADRFPVPAPAPSENVALSVFNNGNPNGTWQLFVVDDYNEDTGSIAGGWSLEITAEVDG